MYRKRVKWAAIFGHLQLHFYKTYLPLLALNLISCLSKHKSRKNVSKRRIHTKLNQMLGFRINRRFSSVNKKKTGSPLKCLARKERKQIKAVRKKKGLLPSGFESGLFSLFLFFRFPCTDTTMLLKTISHSGSKTTSTTLVHEIKSANA